MPLKYVKERTNRIISSKDKILSDVTSCVDHLGDPTYIHLKDEIMGENGSL
jgi:hypothetical protein